MFVSRASPRGPRIGAAVSERPTVIAHRAIRCSVVLCAIACAGQVVADIRVRAIARTGDPVPGLGPEFRFAGFYPQVFDPALAAPNFAMYSATITGPGVTDENNDVLIVGHTASPRLMARSGVQAPGLPAGVLFDQFAMPQCNSSGRVLAPTTLRGASVGTANDLAVYLESWPPGGDPILVLREGDPAPGVPGAMVGTMVVVEIGIAADGRVAAFSGLTGPAITTANNQALYRGLPGSRAGMELLARKGEPVPGLPAGTNYGDFAACSFLPSGDLIVRTALTGPAVTSATDLAFLLFPGGDAPPIVLVREGTTTGGGQTFATLFAPILTNANELMFFGRLAGSPVVSGVFLGAGSVLGPYAGAGLTGSSAQGLPAGVTIDVPNLAKFQFSSARRSAYFSTVAGAGVAATNDTAVFSEGLLGRGQPVLLAREGSVIVGVDPPQVFGSGANPFASISINARHQTAFFGILTGTGVSASNDNALWLVDAAGGMNLAAREGNPITLGPGDIRTIATLGYRLITNGARPTGHWFDDRGRLIAPMAFTDGTGALVLFELDSLCPADFNADGIGGSIQDLFDFLVAWFAQDPRADLNGRDGVSVQDLFDFLALWFAGCV